MLKACIRASRHTLRTPDHLLCLKYYIWVESIFLKFQVTPSAIQNNIVLTKKEGGGPQTQLYSLHLFEPGAQFGDWLLKVIKCKWLGILSLTCIQQTEAV